MTEQQRGVSIGYKLYDIDSPTDTLGDDLMKSLSHLKSPNVQKPNHIQKYPSYQIITDCICRSST